MCYIIENIWEGETYLKVSFVMLFISSLFYFLFYNFYKILLKLLLFDKLCLVWHLLFTFEKEIIYFS